MCALELWCIHSRKMLMNENVYETFAERITAEISIFAKNFWQFSHHDCIKLRPHIMWSDIVQIVASHRNNSTLKQQIESILFPDCSIDSPWSQISPKLYHVPLNCNSISHSLMEFLSFMELKRQANVQIGVRNWILNISWTGYSARLHMWVYRDSTCDFYRRAETVSNFYVRTISLHIHELSLRFKEQEKNTKGWV